MLLNNILLGSFALLIPSTLATPVPTESCSGPIRDDKLVKRVLVGICQDSTCVVNQETGQICPDSFCSVSDKEGAGCRCVPIVD
ncbi:hypothetical protein EDD36DRAFT_463301 [Exophiala viscosa]|uniref:Extracellular membrane protein CFEM domain-containing protein n=1 Tax=Exophiala viscosa TaxID=2486360 RepID=A0AAN6IFN0_9EURO|nr:hypothetical protein EDD36DRAFT_463301 [Exophiala viscosa]